jgi:hypothetical protein
LAAGTRAQLMREEDLLLDLQLAGEALRNPSIAEVSRETFDATLETVVGLIGRAQRSGYLDPDVDADALGRVLIGVFQGFAVQLAIGAPPERERHIRALRRLLAPMLSEEAGARLAESPTINGGGA